MRPELLNTRWSEPQQPRDHFLALCIAWSVAGAMIGIALAVFL